MALVELPVEFSPLLTGSTVEGALLAVRYLEAGLTVSNSAGGDLVIFTGDLGAESAGSSVVSGDALPADLLESSVASVSALAANMQRTRALASSVSGGSIVAVNASARGGIKSSLTLSTQVQALMGVQRPMAAAITQAPAVSARVETGGSILQDIYLQITGTPVYNNNADPVTGRTGTWTVPVTLRRGGSSGTRIPTGSAVVKWGEYAGSPTTDFTGGIILTSDLNNAPYIDVFTVQKNSGGTVFPWDDAALKPRVRMGNLRGVLGNTVDKWGIAMSTDLSNTSAPYIEASNAGLNLKDVNLNITNGTLYVGDAGATKYMQWNGSALTVRGEVRADSGYLGNLSISGTLRTGVSPNPRIEISTTEIAGYSNATTKQFYLQATTGAAYAGGGALVLNNQGLSMVYNMGNPSSIKWYEADLATEVARINTYFANPVPRMQISCGGGNLYLGGPSGNVYTPNAQVASLYLADASYGPGVVYGSQAIGARIYMTLAQNIPNATLWPVYFNAAIFDSWGFFNPALPTRMTVTQYGYYIIGGSYEFSAGQVTGNARVVALVRANGSIYLGIGDNNAISGLGAAVGVTAGAWLNPGDYVELVAYHNIGAQRMVNGATSANQHICQFWMVRIA